jgi:hypothetical protein
MPKFAIGDVVDKDKTHSGTVIAIFTTKKVASKDTPWIWKAMVHCSLSWSAI